MRYKIETKCYDNISRFYQNVARKYSHTYSFEMMQKNIQDAYDGMYKIENGLLRRQPTISRWQNLNCFMANTSKWYYLYKVESIDDTNEKIITVIDACHAQNMHEMKSMNIRETFKWLCENLNNACFSGK